jgi:hypothetical protein
MIRSGPSVYQTNHALLCQLLRKILIDSAQTGRDAAGGIRSMQFRASATPYALLLVHPLDQQSRARSCPSPGAVFGRRRCCWIPRQASYRLRQPEKFLHSQLANEWGLAAPSPPSATAAPDRDSGSRPSNHCRPRSPRRLPPLRRDGRTKITAGPGMIPMASGLAVFHPRTHNRSIRAGRRCSPEA